jgi:hypothetical protein
LRHRDRDQARRHFVGEGNRSTYPNRHRGEARAIEKSAAIDLRPTAEHDGIRALGILRVQFSERSFDVLRHGAPPLLRQSAAPDCTALAATSTRRLHRAPVQFNTRTFVGSSRMRRPASAFPANP